MDWRRAGEETQNEGQKDGANERQQEKDEVEKKHSNRREERGTAGKEKRSRNGSEVSPFLAGGHHSTAMRFWSGRPGASGPQPCAVAAASHSASCSVLVARYGRSNDSQKYELSALSTMQPAGAAAADAEAEAAVDSILARIAPADAPLAHRSSVLAFALDLVHHAHGRAQTFTFGSFPLRVFLPDGDIDVGVCLPPAHVNSFFVKCVASTFRSLLSATDALRACVLRLKEAVEFLAQNPLPQLPVRFYSLINADVRPARREALLCLTLRDRSRSSSSLLETFWSTSVRTPWVRICWSLLFASRLTCVWPRRSGCGVFPGGGRSVDRQGSSAQEKHSPH